MAFKYLGDTQMSNKKLRFCYMLLRLSLVASMLAVVPSRVAAQEFKGLKELLTTAVENSHAMKKAELQQAEAGARRREALSAGLPQVDGSLDYSRMSIPEISISQDMLDALPEDLAPLLQGLSNINAFHTTSAGVTVSQLLYSQTFLSALRQARKAEELQSTLLRKTEEDIIRDVAATYFQILTGYANLAILDKNIDNLEQLHRILELQYENDFVKRTDVSRVKVTVTNLATQRETLLNGIRIQEQILKIISGIPLESVLLLDTAAVRQASGQPRIPTGYAPEALPEYRLLQQQIELAELQVQTDRAAFYPNLAAFGQFTYSSYATEFKIGDFSQMNTVGITAKIPIFSAGMRKQRLKQSQLRLQQSREDFNLNSKYLETSYRNAVNTLGTSWANLRDQEENRALAREVYLQVRLSFDEGMASLTDLLNVETSLLEAESLYNQQLLSYRLAELDLLRATGKLDSLML